MFPCRRRGRKTVPFSAPPLPASTVEYWDSRIGVSLVSGQVDTWTGQVAGKVLNRIAAGQRPNYDYDHRMRNKVVRCSVSGSRALWTGIGSSMIAAGNKPAVYALVNMRLPPGGGNRIVEIYGDNGAGAVSGSWPVVYHISTPDRFDFQWTGSSNLSRSGSTGRHRIRTYSTAASGAVTFRLDDSQTSGGSGATNTSAITSVGLAALFTSTPSQFSDSSFAFVWLGSSEPSAAEWDALDRYARLQHAI